MLKDADLVDAVTSGDGEAVRHRPGQRDRAERLGARDLPGVAGLPDRPLPGQGGRAEHPGVPVRQRALRADLESQLHRPHPDRHPGDARPRPAGELLREHRRLQGHGGHPPVPGDGVRRDGTADRPGAAGHQRGEEQGLPLLLPIDRTTSCAASTWATGRGGCRAGFRYRDVHRAQGQHRQLAVGRRAVLPAHRQADGRGPAHHLDRLQGGAEDDVPGRFRRRHRRAPTT